MEARRVALVTGAARGLGRAIALAFARADVDLVLHTRDSPDIKQVAAEARSLGAAAHIVYADLENHRAVVEMAGQALNQAGSVAILINNVGFRESRPIEAMELSHLRKALAINLEAPLFLAKALIPTMRAVGSGNIINIGGIITHIGATDRTHIVSSKAALEGLTRALARECADGNIRVNMVSPGFLNYPGNQHHLKTVVPLGRVGTAEEIADIVVALCSSAGSYITGQTIHVNGGMYG